MKKKTIKYFSLVCFIASIILWLPNLIFQIPSTWYFGVFIIAPIGILLAMFSKSKWLILGNTLMFFSFFLLMGIGYVTQLIFN